MPNTYTLIASNTLSSSAASVTFSSIPSTYTDLVLKYSVRTNNSVQVGQISVKFNASSTSDYSSTDLEASGVSSLAAVSQRSSAGTYANYVYVNGNSSTASTFGNGEIYIPNYAGSTNKTFSQFSVTENNAAANVSLDAVAHLRSNAAAITEINLANFSTTQFASGSSFFLYGISNS